MLVPVIRPSFGARLWRRRMPSECCKNILVVNVKSLCTNVVLKRSVIWSNLQFFDTERPQPKEIGFDFL